MKERRLCGKIVAGLALALAFHAVAAPMEIGWAERDITPSLDGKKVPLAGLYYIRHATNVQSRLKFTCCVIRQGNEQVLMGSVDVVSGWQPFTDKVNERLSALIPEIRPGSVFIGCPHIHSAPYLRPCFTPAADNFVKKNPDCISPNEYGDFVLERAVAAFAEAWRNAKPGRVSRAFGNARVGHCRITKYKDGTSEMYGDTSRPDFAGMLEGEDSGVEMLFTENLAGKKTGVFINAACPAQVMEQLYVVSSDFSGATREKLAAAYGRDFHTIYQLGPGGDQSPRDLTRAGTKMDGFDGWHADAVAAISDRLVACVKEAMPRAAACPDILRHTRNVVKLPIRRVSDAEVAEAKRELAALKEKWPGDAAWKDYLRDTYEHEKAESRFPYDTKLHPYAVMDVYAAVLKRAETQDKEPWLDTTFHVVRIGDVAFVSNPFELYLVFGQVVKARSAAKQTFLIGKCHSSGYVPTEASEKAVGYSGGVNVGKIGHEGGYAFADAVVEKIADLFK